MTTLLRRLHRAYHSGRFGFAATCAVVVVGLLIWARLRLITNYPRSAIADEPPAAVATPDAPSDDADVTTPDAPPINPASSDAGSVPGRTARPE